MRKRRCKRRRPGARVGSAGNGRRDAGVSLARCRILIGMGEEKKPDQVGPVGIALVVVGALAFFGYALVRATSAPDAQAAAAVASPVAIGSVTTLRARTIGYDTELTMDETLRLARQGDKEAMGLVISSRGTHLDAGTQVKIIGIGDGPLRRRIEVAGVNGSPERWWVDYGALSP